jgi:ABC-type Mn2+/Zn2+ transport system permease subunit
MFLVAPLVAAGGTLLGLIASFGLDLPPGPTAVCALALTYLACVAGRRGVDLIAT